MDMFSCHKPTKSQQVDLPCARIMIFFVVIQGVGAISPYTALINSIVLSVPGRPEGRGCFKAGILTPPKTNISPKKGLFQQEIHVPSIDFQGAFVRFPGRKWESQSSSGWFPIIPL